VDDSLLNAIQFVQRTKNAQIANEKINDSFIVATIIIFIEDIITILKSRQDLFILGDSG
jgi:hypothetical protein